MKSVEAFKNSLKNYYYDLEQQKKLSKLKENVEEALKGKEYEDAIKLLMPFNKELDRLDKELDGTYTKLTGFSGISYDKQPSSYNQELSEYMRLELIEKYNSLLKKADYEIVQGIVNLNLAITRNDNNILFVESVLNELDDEIRYIAIEVYAKGRTMEDVSDDKQVYLSKSGIYWAVNNKLESILKN